MKKYLFFSIALLSLYSCKKDPSKPSYNSPSPKPESNTAPVVQTIKLDTDYKAGKYVYEDYRYDYLNRVIRYFSYSVDSSVTPARIDTIHGITFLYKNADEKLPAFSNEVYRSPLYKLSNSSHMYLYDAQKRLILDSLIFYYPQLTSRGVNLSRRVHYNGNNLTVDNLNLDSHTGIKGRYRDIIIMDARGNAVKTQIINGKDYITNDIDDFAEAGVINNNYAYNNLENPFNKMNISQVMAFVQTGFPGGDFYRQFLSKNYCATILSNIPRITDTQLTYFKYITNPLKGNRVEKTIITRDGANQHGGFMLLNYK